MLTSRKTVYSDKLILLVSATFIVCLIGLIWLYLNVPPGFQQFKYWSPRPNHSVEVATLFRETLKLPYQPISETAFRVGNLILLITLFTSYGLILFIAPNGLKRQSFWLLTLLMGIVALFIPPFYATDVFYYGITGQITAIYQQNPYLQAPAEFTNSVLLPLNYWVDITSPYGPLWTTFSGWLTLLTQAHPFLTPFIFKVAGMLALWGCALLLDKITQTKESELIAWKVVLFAWNPLILLDSVVNGHNDILMALFIILAASFILKQKPLAGFAAASLAVWIKYMPAPLALWSLMVRIRPGMPQRLRTIGTYTGVFVVLMLLLWFPHWQGPQTVASLFAESARGLSGVVPFFASLLGIIFSFDPILLITILFITSVVLFFAWGLWSFYRLWRKDVIYTPQDELLDWAMIYTWIVMILPGSHPWYIVPSLALWAICYTQAKRRALLVYGLFSFWFFYRAVAWG